MGWDAWKTSWEEEGEANVNIGFFCSAAPERTNDFKAEAPSTDCAFRDWIGSPSAFTPTGST